MSQHSGFSSLPADPFMKLMWELLLAPSLAWHERRNVSKLRQVCRGDADLVWHDTIRKTKCSKYFKASRIFRKPLPHGMFHAPLESTEIQQGSKK